MRFKKIFNNFLIILVDGHLVFIFMQKQLYLLVLRTGTMWKSIFEKFIFEIIHCLLSCDNRYNLNIKLLANLHLIYAFSSNHLLKQFFEEEFSHYELFRFSNKKLIKCLGNCENQCFTNNFMYLYTCLRFCKLYWGYIPLPLGAHRSEYRKLSIAPLNFQLSLKR